MADSYVGYAPANRLSLAPGSVSVGALNTTGTASSSTYLRGDMAWTANPLGDVVGPGSATDDALVKYDGTTGKLVQNSNATLTDAGLLTATTIAGTLTTAAQANITSLGTIASLVATTADINGGNIDDTIIGATTAVAGSFTTLSASTSITGTLATAAQTNITSVGTIGTGVWEGTAVADAYVATASTWNGAVTTANAALPKSGGTMSGAIQMADLDIQKPNFKDYSETKQGVAGAASVDLDMVNGNVITVTGDANTTFTFSNPSPSGKSCAFTLIWTQGSSDYTITWPASVDWPAATAPDVTSGAGKVDVYTFFTFDAGTIWYGFQAGADMS